MPYESRVKKSILNARANLVFYFLGLLIAFFSRKLFLDTLGADFIGLVGTLNNLLGFLNLAEMGISIAIGYVLYKPLFEYDKCKINEIISVFRYIYRCIGLFILGTGCVLACFLPVIFPNNVFNLGVIYFAFFSFLTSTLIGYFANYKQTLLGADQKNYVVTTCFQSAAIVRTLIQIILVYYTNNYYLWIGMELISGIAYSIILNWKIKQIYPWLTNEITKGKTLLKKYPEVSKYTKQLFIHKLGFFIQFQTAPFLIYAFVSLRTVALYGNYTIITEKINILINNLLGSTSAGVGSLIAEGNQEKIKSVFWELLGIRFLIAGVISCALFQLLPPFIVLWVGEEYLLPPYILIMLIINSFINYTRGTTDQFLNGYGLFKDIWAPITEILIYLIVAIIGGHYYGLPGILAGGISSQFFIIGIWKPYFLYKEGFKSSVLNYWAGYLKHLVLILPPIFLCIYLFPNEKSAAATSYEHWLLYALLNTSTCTFITAVLLYLFTPEMRITVKRFLKKK